MPAIHNQKNINAMEQNNNNQTDIVQISIVHDYSPTGLRAYHMISNGKQLGNKPLLPDEIASLVVVLIHALSLTWAEVRMVQSAGEPGTSLKEYLEGVVEAYLENHEGETLSL